MIQRDLKTKRKAISPIIATLLLILIAIAAGVVVYAYVIGFVGNSTNNTGGTQSLISVDNLCVSVSGKCAGSTYLSISVRNVGSSSLSWSASSSASLYLVDVTSGKIPAGTITCPTSGSTGPGATFTCAVSVAWTSNAPSAGDTVTVKVVNPDGGTTSSSARAVA